MQFSGWQAIFLSALGGFTAYFGLLAGRARRRLLRMAAALVVLSVALALASLIFDSREVEGVVSFLQTVLFLAAALTVLRAVVTAESVHVGSIGGAVSVYIMLSLLFAFVYVAVDRILAGSFFGTTDVQEGDFLFFSTTTLTTTGYGNLVPAGELGQMLAAMEMLTGQLFVVTLIARLVSSWQPGEWLRQGAGITRRHRPGDTES
jgi:hypothetical protein